MHGLLALSLALNLAALALIAVLLVQPSTLGVGDDHVMTTLERRVTTLERQVEAAPKLADLRAEVAAIRRGPKGERGPRGVVGPPGPAGSVEGYELDDFESRISDLELADPDPRLSDLESFRSDLCSSFLQSSVEPISDLYYYGPC